MKDGRFEVAIRDCIIATIQRKLVVLHAPRPPHFDAETESIIRALHGSDDDEWLYKLSNTGEKAPWPLLPALRELFGALDPDIVNADMIHWYWVLPGT